MPEGVVPILSFFAVLIALICVSIPVGQWAYQQHQEQKATREAALKQLGAEYDGQLFGEDWSTTARMEFSWQGEQVILDR